jgi:predicted exporter
MHISTNLLTLFAPKESIKTLHIANELGYSKELLIAVKGFDEESKQELEHIVKALHKLPEIKNINYTLMPPREIKNYYRTYYPVLAVFNDANISKELVRKRLLQLYNQQLHSFFYKAVNKNDPLGLFHMPKSQIIAHKGRYITLGTYGYLIKATTNVSPAETAKAKELYVKIQETLQHYPRAIAFAGFFYTVENSAKIKGDVKHIVIISVLVLLLIYLIMLRDIKLLLQTTMAQASSMLFATLICTTTMENFGALSLAFGISLSAVSIDYLFHYYFHNFYHQKKRFDKNVFFGFATTVSAFAIFAFIPIPMIAQISIFAVLSLSFAYVIFTFVFKYIDIKEFSQIEIREKAYKKTPAVAVTLFSLILFTYALLHMHYDDNIRNLDYQNKKLQKIQQIFQSANKTKLLPVIIEASSKEILLQRIHAIKNVTKESFSLANFVLDKQQCEQKEKELLSYDFERLNRDINRAASQIGFRDSYFGDAYKFTRNLPQCDSVDFDIFKTYNLSIYQEGSKYYTIAMVENIDKIAQYKFVHLLDIKSIFSKVADNMLVNIIKYSIVVLLLIFILLFFSVRQKFFYALNYILFPLALSFFIVALLYKVNIMHLFSFIILIAIGIDYGIYMSNTKKVKNTVIAIKYSLLSTLAAFGVLAFSAINALYSIGIVISIGVGAIYLLTKVMR